MQDEKTKAINVLEKIYDPDRLQEELDSLSAAADDQHNSSRSIGYLDIFKIKEIRVAFFTGASLQVDFFV